MKNGPLEEQAINDTGGGSRIRTHGTSRYNGFQDRRFQPLSHSSICKTANPRIAHNNGNIPK